MAEGAADVPVTPALRRTARGRADLYRALIDLDQAAARPGVGRERDWIAGVRGAVELLRSEIEAHVAITEGADGLYGEITAAAPRLINAIDDLREEHVEMRTRAATMAAKLAELPPDAESVADARTEISLLLGFLVKHRQRGSDLVWEAYALDIGGVG